MSSGESFGIFIDPHLSNHHFLMQVIGKKNNEKNKDAVKSIILMQVIAKKVVNRSDVRLTNSTQTQQPAKN